MSKRIGEVSIIEVEPDFICGTCGKITECRPYGPGGSEICYDCGMKIPDIIKHNMGIKLFGNAGNLK